MVQNPYPISLPRILFHYQLVISSVTIFEEITEIHDVSVYYKLELGLVKGRTS